VVPTPQAPRGNDTTATVVATPAPVLEVPAAPPPLLLTVCRRLPLRHPPKAARRRLPQTRPPNLEPHSDARRIYTANLTMAVYQETQGMDSVEQIGKEEGGYLSTRSDNAVTIRVPRDRFREALAHLEKLGDVLHRDFKAEDVTDEFVDLEARLRNARAKRDRLTLLLQKAPIKEAIDIEKELGRVTEEIERMEGRMKVLKDRIAFSTISVSFSPRGPIRPRHCASRSFSVAREARPRVPSQCAPVRTVMMRSLLLFSLLALLGVA
jgi:hypothetical protein